MQKPSFIAKPASSMTVFTLWMVNLSRYTS